MPIGIQNAAGTSEKTKDPSLHKGNTGSQTVAYGLLPTGVDSYASVAVELSRLMAGQLFLRAVYARIMCGTPRTFIILIAGIQCCSLYVQTGYSSWAVFCSVLYPVCFRWDSFRQDAGAGLF